MRQFTGALLIVLAGCASSRDEQQVPSLVCRVTGNTRLSPVDLSSSRLEDETIYLFEDGRLTLVPNGIDAPYVYGDLQWVNDRHWVVGHKVVLFEHGTFADAIVAHVDETDLRVVRLRCQQRH